MLWQRVSDSLRAAQYDGRGFTLIEVTIAAALLAVGGAGLASLALASGRAVQFARQADVAQRAAVERLEQLRALDKGLAISVARVCSVLWNM